jgi:hypothetical protein
VSDINCICAGGLNFYGYVTRLFNCMKFNIYNKNNKVEEYNEDL